MTQREEMSIMKERFKTIIKNLNQSYHSKGFSNGCRLPINKKQYAYKLVEAFLITYAKAQLYINILISKGVFVDDRELLLFVPQKDNYQLTNEEMEVFDGNK